MVSCVGSLRHFCVEDVLKGMATTGAWLCFESIDKLQLPVMSLACQMLETVSTALVNKQSTVMIQKSETKLVSGCACFATVTSTSLASNIAKDLRTYFRTIEFATPQVKLIAEALFLKEGFYHGPMLASKLTYLCHLSQEILVQAGMFYLSKTVSKLSAIGIETVKHVILQASIVREALALSTPKPTYEHAGEDGETKFIVHDGSRVFQSSECERLPIVKEQTDEAILEEAQLITTGGVAGDVEEQAVVVALRDLILPQLSGDDHKLFVTFLSEIFPSAGISRILDVEWQAQSTLIRQEMHSPTARSRANTACSEDVYVSSSAVTIASAIAKLGLQSNGPLQRKVAQLGQLLNTYHTVWRSPCSHVNCPNEMSCVGNYCRSTRLWQNLFN